MAKKILLADDSITIQKVIELTFSDEDFDVVTVGNGRLALEKLEDVRPDIVLCDIIMPEKDGYEVCQQIKSNPAFSQVPVLLLTGAFEPFDQEKAAQVGSNGFLAKPFEPETLIAKVKDLMGRAGGPDEGAPPAGAGLAVSEGPSLPADDAATATTAPQPAVAPSPPPAEPTPPEAEPSAPATFIPEEPYAPLESAVSPGASDEPLAPMTPEESATLAGEPPAGAAAGEDSASTVMFNAGDLPWTGQTPPESPATETAAPLEPPPAEAGFAPTPGAPDLADEAGAAFEEVLEEDLEFGGGSGLASGAKPGALPGDADIGAFTPGEPLTEAVTGTTEPEPPPTFEAVTPVEPEPPGPEAFSVAPQFRSEADTPTAPTPALETRPPLQTEPPVPPEPPPTFEVATASEPEPLVAEEVPEPQAVFEEPAPPKRQPETLPPVQPEPETPAAEPPLAPLAGPEPSAAPAPPAAAPGLEDTASFADVRPEPLPEADSGSEPVAGAVSASEAASVSVPVEQVEKIAQRVVAQVSEKVVREIAWEVIPDLAEALIKQEIERLKAELEKL